MQGAVVEALTAWRRDGTPRPARRLADHGRPAQRARPAPLPRPAGPRDRAARRAAGRRAPAPDAGAGHRRPAAAAVRLLPPGAGARGPAGADPARGHRSHHAPDRPGVPGQRADAGAADRPRQAQDRRHRHRAQGARRDLDERLPDVLAVVYLAYNEALRLLHRQHPRPRPRRRRRLARRGRRHQPARPRRGLGPGRAAARSSTAAPPPGSPRTATWCCSATRTARCGTRAAIKRAGEHLERAASLRSPGRYQLQAAIALCHAEAPSWEETDWLQIVTLYGVLIQRGPLARGPAQRRDRARPARPPPGRRRPGRGRSAREPSSPATTSGTPTRAELLRLNGRDDEADTADRRALELTGNDAERRLIQTRLRRHPLHRRVVPIRAALAGPSVPSKAREAGLVEDRDPELLGLVGLGAGVVADHDVVGLLRHRAGGLAAAGQDRLLGASRG